MLFGSPKYPALLLLFLFSLQACSGPAHRRASAEDIDKGQLIKVARAQIGKRYRFGGQTPSEGFDCSGLVYYSFKKVGLDVPRTSFGQFKYTQPVTKPKMKPGDLLFFRIFRSRISHVAIYLGDNRFIHAPSTGKQVTIGRLDNPYWRKRFVRAGRI